MSFGRDKEFAKVAEILNNSDKSRDYSYMCDTLRISDAKLLRLLLEMQRSRTPYPNINNDNVFVTKNASIFCLASDLHWGSKICDPSYFRKLLETCNDVGCDTILFSGDLIQGFDAKWNHLLLKNYRDPSRFADIMINEFPSMDKGGIDKKFYFIRGNHDTKDAGIRICQRLSLARPELIYLGDYHASVQFYGSGSKLARTTFEISHGFPLDPGISNNREYAEFLHNNGRKTDFIELGHYHQGAVEMHNGSLLLQVLALAKDRGYVLRKNSQNIHPSGFYLLKVNYDNYGSVNDAQVEQCIFTEGQKITRSLSSKYYFER